MLHYIDIAIVVSMMIGFFASPIMALKMGLPMMYSWKMLGFQFQMMFKTPVLMVVGIVMAAVSIYVAKWIGLEYTYQMALYSTIIYWVIGIVAAKTQKDVDLGTLFQ